ncbi:hypothetical protein [Kitasatospora sp. NPDC056531]|uniref:hypothetical protein n=1 Tax=Kitasatospora sp. NPDC056531 TaxID=3345856 RepID=UPI0036BAF6C9
MQEGIEELDFIGIAPETSEEGSPTVRVDHTRQETMIQGWSAFEKLVATISETTWTPGHAPGIPEGEIVNRIPARMVPILREACDVAERAGL